MNGRRSVIDELNCCFSDTYKNQTVFTFIPGHRAAILGIPNQIDRMKAEKQQKKTDEKTQNTIIRGIEEDVDRTIEQFSIQSRFQPTKRCNIRA